MEKIDDTRKNVGIIARAEFKKQSGKDLNDEPQWIRDNWISSADDMLDSYNRVVDIFLKIQKL